MNRTGGEPYQFSSVVQNHIAFDVFVAAADVAAVFVAVDMFAVFCFWPLRFLLRSFRFSSSARWLSRCRACVAVAELFAAAAAGDTLRCCFLGL